MRLYRFVFFIIVVVIVSLSKNAFSADYKSDKFPPNEIILKQPWQRTDYRPFRILGKQNVANNEFKLFYIRKTKSGYPELNSMTVIKLDTNLWLHMGAQGLQNSIFSE